MNPSLAIIASGLAMAARVCSSDRPWMITVPPAARALRERRAGEALAGRHELVQRESCIRPRLPIVEQRRLDLGHARAVRIRFGRHILPGITRGFDRRRETRRSRRPRTS